MSNIKTKELIICILAVTALVLALATNVFATDLSELINDTNNTNVATIQEETNNTSNNTLNTNTQSTNIQNISTENNAIQNNNTTEDIPYTGVSYSSVVIIAIAAVSAIYAYKKIRDYNV